MEYHIYSNINIILIFEHREYHIDILLGELQLEYLYIYIYIIYDVYHIHMHITLTLTLKIQNI